MLEKLPNEDNFDANFAKGTPLLDAVQELCDQTNHTLEEMERKSMGEIYRMAAAHYGEDLSSFWKNWSAWNQEGLNQSMGDL
ncbi:MAG: hypothetical protein ACKVH8_06825 [Pirellulales bacterium]|jgi:hypothetical protein